MEHFNFRCLKLKKSIEYSRMKRYELNNCKQVQNCTIPNSNN